MLGDSLASLEGQVQPGKSGIALLEGFDDAERVQIMVEAIAEALHLAVQLILAGVREGRMPNVVAEGQGFGQILV